MLNSVRKGLKQVLEEIRPYVTKIIEVINKYQTDFIEETQMKNNSNNQFQEIDTWYQKGQQMFKKFFHLDEIPKEKILSTTKDIDELIKDIKFVSQSQIIATQFLDYVYEKQNADQCRAEYVQQYSLNQDEEQIFGKIKGFQRVRGDGNCCYTSIFYQYLNYLINYGTEEEEKKFKEKIEQMNLILFCQQKNVLRFPNQEHSVKEYFLGEYDKLKQHKNLLQMFTYKNEKFYTCSIIILKNLIKEAYLQNQKDFKDFVSSDLENEILTWGFECNTNQVVLLLVSEVLNMHVTIFQFMKQQKHLSIQIDQYNENKNLFGINLLFRPGHYQIAIC